MRKVAIVGAGMVPFGERFDQGMKELLPAALQNTLASVDNGMDRSQIQAAWFGQLQSSDGHPAGVLADSCGLLDIPITRIENQCATGNDAVRIAYHAIASGAVDIALVIGADKIRETPATSTFWDWMGLARDRAWDYPLGLIAPASFALHVVRYMHEFDVEPQHLAQVAVKNHHNAVTNPVAQLRFEVTIEKVLAAPRVVGPFGVLDCTPQSDGAAALILTSEDVARDFTDSPVWVRGVGLGLDRVMHAHKADMTTFPATVRAARAAYDMAGIGPSDIDVAEVHDCFSGIELMNYEDLGFCDRGEAKKLISSGETEVGGRLPVNPSGGLKAKGHPPGATGVAQCVELFEQLRGEAVNQVRDPRWGLAHNIGGPTAVGAVTILESSNV
ncbi:thiolase C-terminal domain-containing protein [Gordonia polyisoprenivorans]|uniref:thiolase C-terminal domain-containing protein n=1 Tax=Gordonia polyisoprenivorans TaxID=84595 RepID=UPI001AD7E1E2|nr:thiolase family protein [Gordonia polyisoprenivorans]QTI69930.1 thiolase family protein [Gordonia polyisoprenivorans]